VQFGVYLGPSQGSIDGEFLVAAAQSAERLGFDSLWMTEHVVWPVEHRSKYPYSRNGTTSVDDTAPLSDPLISLAMAAAATRTIKLGTGVIILPQRNPVILAKEAATLDRLSEVAYSLAWGWVGCGRSLKP